jgi:hypothetical protein
MCNSAFTKDRADPHRAHFAEQVWGEIWEFIEIPLQNCLKGIPTAQDNQLLFWDRLKEGPNKMEEVYATWYYVPYFSQDRVIGNLHMLFEQQNKQVRMPPK